MTAEANIPKAMDTPAKKREWLDICDKIHKQVGYVRFYKQEVARAEKSLRRAKRELKELRELREFIRKGKPTKQRGYGWTKFELEDL